MSKDFLTKVSIVTALATAFLLVAGALVTGTGSGLAVPDWPLSFGQFFPEMKGGVFYEHGHRMVAGTVAILATLQCILIQKYEERKWVKNVALFSVGLVLFQALLGGMTVLFRLPTMVSVLHACMAQAFFTTTIIIAFSMSSYWESGLIPSSGERQSKEKHFELKNYSLILSLLFILQLVLGATMRHMGAGLVISDFPTVFGGVFPPYFTPRILVHYLHRVGAFTLIGFTSFLVYQIYKNYSRYLFLVGLAGLLVSLLSFQFMLGAMVIWLRRPLPITTTHLVIGAFCLATSVVLTITCHRLEQKSEAGEKSWVLPEMEPA